MISDWIKVAAMSFDELKEEFLKSVKEHGGPEAAQDALANLEGGTRSKAGWVTDEIYVKAYAPWVEEDEGHPDVVPVTDTKKEDDVVSLPSIGDEEYPESDSRCQECKGPCYPGAMYCKKCVQKLFPKPEEPAAAPRPKGPAISPEKTKYLAMLLAALMAGLVGGAVDPDLTKKVDINKLIKFLGQVNMAAPRKQSPKVVKAPSKPLAPSELPRPSLLEETIVDANEAPGDSKAFHWAKFKDNRAEGEKEYDAQIKAWQSGIDLMKNKATRPEAQKRLDEFQKASNESYRKVFLE